MNKSKKGQAATEALVMLGFIIAFSLPIIALLFVTVNVETEEININLARVSAKAIADATNEVCAQGNGSRKMILVQFPENIWNVTTENYEVVFQINATKGNLEVVSVTYANITAAGNNTIDGIRGVTTYIRPGLHMINITNAGKNVEVSYVQ